MGVIFGRLFLRTKVGLDVSPSCDRQMRFSLDHLCVLGPLSIQPLAAGEIIKIRLHPHDHLVRDFPQLCVRVSEYFFPKSVMAIKIPPSWRPMASSSLLSLS